MRMRFKLQKKRSILTVQWKISSNNSRKLSGAIINNVKTSMPFFHAKLFKGICEKIESCYSPVLMLRSTMMSLFPVHFTLQGGSVIDSQHDLFRWISIVMFSKTAITLNCSQQTINDSEKVINALYEVSWTKKDQMKFDFVPDFQSDSHENQWYKL